MYDLHGRYTSAGVKLLTVPGAKQWTLRLYFFYPLFCSTAAVSPELMVFSCCVLKQWGAVLACSMETVFVHSQ